MSEPRVQAVQTMVRVFYEDGTVAMVTVEPAEVLSRDALEPDTVVPVGAVQDLVESQYEAIQSRVSTVGLDELYRQIKKETSERRAEVAERAEVAHRRHQSRSSDQN